MQQQGPLDIPSSLKGSLKPQLDYTILVHVMGTYNILEDGEGFVYLPLDPQLQYLHHSPHDS